MICAVRFCVENEIALLRSMLVAEEFRGKGVGQLLLREFEDFLNSKKVDRTYCIPYRHLIDFYGKIGFKEIPLHQVPLFLLERFLSYCQKNPHLSYSVMIRKHESKLILD